MFALQETGRSATEYVTFREVHITPLGYAMLAGIIVLAIGALILWRRRRRA